MLSRAPRCTTAARCSRRRRGRRHRPARQGRLAPLVRVECVGLVVLLAHRRRALPSVGNAGFPGARGTTPPVPPDGMHSRAAMSGEGGGPLRLFFSSF